MPLYRIRISRVVIDVYNVLTMEYFCFTAFFTSFREFHSFLHIVFS